MGLSCKRNLLWLCALLSVVSLFQSLALLIPRNFAETSHRGLYLMYILPPLKTGILEQNLEQRHAFVRMFSDVDFCLY